MSKDNFNKITDETVLFPIYRKIMAMSVVLGGCTLIQSPGYVNMCRIDRLGENNIRRIYSPLRTPLARNAAVPVIACDFMNIVEFLICSKYGIKPEDIDINTDDYKDGVKIAESKMQVSDLEALMEKVQTNILEHIKTNVEHGEELATTVEQVLPLIEEDPKIKTIMANAYSPSVNENEHKKYTPQDAVELYDEVKKISGRKIPKRK